MNTRYIDPTTDFGFKRLFGREESKEVLKGFLFDILDLPHPIADLSYMTNEQLPESPIQRVGIYDVYCTDTTGSRFIVEMQRSWVGFFKERTIYYATFPIREQVEKGEHYLFRLLPIYCISILRYRMDDEPYYRRCIKLANVETGTVFYENLTFVFLELPKFDKALEEMDNATDRWLYMLKHMTELDSIPTQLSEAPMPQAFRIAEMAAMTTDERSAYHESMKRKSDEIAILESHVEKGRLLGWEEGREEGREEGLQEGLQQGRDDERREMARRMLDDGIDAAIVAKYTGITVDELRGL